MKDNTLYIQPLDELHDSGYKYIEVGYVVNGKKEALGRCSDVINFGFLGMDDMPKNLNIDVTADGIIQLWSHVDSLEWEQPILSSAKVIVKNKVIKVKEKKYLIGLKDIADENTITHYLWKDMKFYPCFEKSENALTLNELAELTDNKLAKDVGYDDLSELESVGDIVDYFWVNPIIKLVPVEA